MLGKLHSLRTTLRCCTLQVKTSLEGEIQYLLRQRENDPYRSLPRRLLYETFTQRQAPTFPLPPTTPPQGVAGFR